MSSSKSGAEQGADAPRKGEALGANTEIGRKLRQLYDGVMAEQVPDRFAQLLRQLESAEPPRGGSKG